MDDHESFFGDNTRRLNVWYFGGAWFVHRGSPLRYPVLGPFDNQFDAQKALDRYVEAGENDPFAVPPFAVPMSFAD